MLFDETSHRGQSHTSAPKFRAQSTPVPKSIPHLQTRAILRLSLAREVHWLAEPHEREGRDRA